MSASEAIYICSPLDKKQHDRAGFSCAASSLTNYIRQNATEDVKRRAAAVHVMTAENDSSDLKTIVGYYSLSADSLSLHDLPAHIRGRLANYERVSATLLGRLAVDNKFAGRGLGTELLRRALLMCLEQSHHVGSAVVVVDALNERAASFYTERGFEQLDKPLRLFIPMATIRESVDS